MIPGDLLSAFPHRQFHTLLGLLDSWAALPNSYPNALRAMQGGSLYHFYDGLWYDPAERRTHDLPCERRTRYRLSQPDTVTQVYLECFQCGGTTHVLRLNWSPDGTYIVSAHAMNNSGPTAQIVEREGWRATMDFVGHRKAVTVVVKSLVYSIHLYYQ